MAQLEKNPPTNPGDLGLTPGLGRFRACIEGLQSLMTVTSLFPDMAGMTPFLRVSAGFSTPQELQGIRKVLHLSQNLYHKPKAIENQTLITLQLEKQGSNKMFPQCFNREQMHAN